jgi:hypothetical protein
MKRLAFLLPLMLASVVHAQVVYFAGGVARAEVPPGYDHYFEQRRKTLVVLPPALKGVEIRVTFNSLLQYVKQRPSIGKDMVQDAAKKKDKQVFMLTENGGVGFVDFSENRVYGSTPMQETHGMLGLDDGYATFTISIPVSQLASEASKQFLSTGFKAVLARIRSRGA